MKNFRQRGFSMIEVLVTFLLITIGVLGMVAMQARAIAYTQDSVQRNTAAMLTDDLMEMMRANREEVLNVNGDPKSESGYYKAKGAALATPPDSCTPTPINPGQQIACWAENVKQALPGAADLLASEFYIRPEGSAIEVQLAWMVRAGECMDDGAEDNEPAADAEGSAEEGANEEAEDPEAEDPEQEASTSPCRYRLRSEI